MNSRRGSQEENIFFESAVCELNKQGKSTLLRLRKTCKCSIAREGKCASQGKNELELAKSNKQ